MPGMESGVASLASRAIVQQARSIRHGRRFSRDTYQHDQRLALLSCVRTEMSAYLLSFYFSSLLVLSSALLLIDCGLPVPKVFTIGKHGTTTPLAPVGKARG